MGSNDASAYFDHRQDYRVYEFLKLTGLLELPKFDWISTSYSDGHVVTVSIRSYSKHSEMATLIQKVYGKPFLYIVADKEWHEPGVHVGHFTMVFNGVDFHLDTWGDFRYPLPNGDRLLRDGD